MENILMQAYRGVSSDYPENTFSAFKGAVYQDYDAIAVDLNVTSDGKIVAFAGNTVCKTATHPDGKAISEDTRLDRITYAEAQRYDYGRWFSLKYKGEKLPLLEQVLTFAKEHGITLKLNPAPDLTFAQTRLIFDAINQGSCSCGFTVNTPEAAQIAKDRLLDCRIHYEGEISPGLLAELSAAVPRDRLTIWVSLDACRTEGLCQLIKGCASLGIKPLSQYTELEAAKNYGADIIETCGSLKPMLRHGVIPDVHIHSEHSHDADFPISTMRKAAREKGVDIICITDHCDIVFSDRMDPREVIRRSVADSKNEAKNTDDAVTVYTGVEIGEAIWDLELAKEVSEFDGLDQIIGSLHAIRFPEYTLPFVDINFGEMDSATLDRFINTYFDNIIELINTLSFDVLAHLTVPMRYINGKYNLSVDCHRYEDKIKKILSLIIQKGIALEVNTSFKGSGQFYDQYLPEEWIIKLYKEMGGHLIVCNSDAHIPQRVGHRLDEAYAMLRRLGFEYVCYFKDRFACQCML